MPRPISHEQQEALEARGIVVPGAEREALPPETIARVLGSVGLPHSEKVERLDEETTFSIESIDNPSFLDSYNTTYKATRDIMTLIGEPIPSGTDIGMTMQLTELKPAFDTFQARGLQPELVLTPNNRTLEFWEDLFKSVHNSPLNPEEPDPNNSGQRRKVLRNNGLRVDGLIKDQWSNLTNPSDEPPSWQVSVTSATPGPRLSSVTSYGCIDDKNQFPDHNLNDLLVDLRKPILPVRASWQLSQTPVQPDIHPTPESYMMHQLTRIVQSKEPLDSNVWLWLNGTLESGYMPACAWSLDNSQVFLEWDDASIFDEDIGIRPSVRANHA